MTGVLRQPPSASADKRLTRLLTAGVETALEQFANPEMLAAGKVNLIALDAVAERFGNRWASRQAQVHEHVQGMLDRQIGAQGYHLRISDTDILICQPDLGRLAGQASSLRLLRDILSHFLGAAELFADVKIHEVLSVSPAGVEARPVDPAASLAIDDEPSAMGSKVNSAPESVLAPVSTWTPFVASNGCKIDVACTLDPVFELKGSVTIGLRFRRSVIDATTGRAFRGEDLARLSRSDRLRIDLGALAVGLDQLRRECRSMPPPALILSISFSSLSNVDDRARVVAAFQEARAFARKGLICELREIDGVPAATLQTAATAIAPFSLFVIGLLAEVTRTEALVLKDAGLRGISSEWPTHLDQAAFLGWAKKTVHAGKHATRSVLLYRLPSQHQAMVAAAFGATHAHVAGLSA